MTVVRRPGIARGYVAPITWEGIVAELHVAADVEWLMGFLAGSVWPVRPGDWRGAFLRRLREIGVRG